MDFVERTLEKSEYMKKVSVVTMSYNDKEHLEACLNGILAQDYPEMECIVVDGGSTDGTVELLRRLRSEHGDRFHYISEKDKGLYDALNKGIQMADGDIVGLMCDVYANEHVLSDMVAAIEKQHADGVHGDLDYVSSDGTVVRKWRMGKGKIRSGWMPAHPTLYLKKEVYETYGLYKIDYKIAADYEFMIRILKDDKVKLAYIPKVLVKMFHGENSSSTGGIKNYVASLKEGHRALVENDVKAAWLIDFARIMRVLVQFVSSRISK